MVVEGLVVVTVVVVVAVAVVVVVLAGVVVEVVVVSFLSMIIKDPPIKTGMMAKIKPANIAIFKKTIVKLKKIMRMLVLKGL